MKDKRKTRRRYLLYYMRIYDGDSRQQIGNLVDITPEGAMILTEDPVEVGKTLHLRMELTVEVAEKPFMDFTARTIWCEQDVAPHLYNCGLEIQEIQPEDIKIIRRIIKEFGFRENRLE
ncbi:MAG TPA: PilZ domain-containing protein [Anaerolineales bacterium]|nr:PilZ domain-containing protein [Anaerolineales bacterium]